MPSISPPESFSSPGAYRYRSWSNLGQLTVDSSSIFGQRLAISGTRTRISVNTPNYGLAKATGKLPFNYFRFNEASRTGRLGWNETEAYDYLRKRWYRNTRTDGILGPWAVDVAPSFSTFSMENEAILNLREKIKDVDFDAAVFAGELRETVGMLKELSARLNAFLRHLRYGRPADALRALDLSNPRSRGRRRRGQLKGAIYANLKRHSSGVSNGWLLWTYGIKPLISDIQGALKAIDKGLAERSERYVLVTARVEKADRKDTYSSTYGVSIPWSAELAVTVRAKVRVDSPYLVLAKSLGLTNPLVVGWELTRLSFVADWIIGIGSWLSQFDALSGIVVDQASVTTFKKIEGRLQASGKSSTSSSRSAWSYNATDLSVSVERQAYLGTIPLATLPPLYDKLGLFHAVTTAALVRQGAFKP